MLLCQLLQHGFVLGLLAQETLNPVVSWGLVQLHSRTAIKSIHVAVCRVLDIEGTLDTLGLNQLLQLHLLPGQL